MNYCGLDLCDVLNGTGFRITLFVSGCSHHCKECQNSKTWDINYGKHFDDNVRNIIFTELKKDYIDGITVTGGDPLHENNYEEIYQLIVNIKMIFPDKTIWLYTGYTWDQLVYDDRFKVVKMCDVLVDGEFEINKRDVSLKFRGSSNQRLINVPETLKTGKITEIQ